MDKEIVVCAKCWNRGIQTVIVDYHITEETICDCVESVEELPLAIEPL